MWTGKHTHTKKDDLLSCPNTRIKSVIKFLLKIINILLKKNVLQISKVSKVLHHSADTMLCFRIYVFVVLRLVSFSKSQQRAKTTCLFCRTDPVCLPQYFLLFFNSRYSRYISIGTSKRKIFGLIEAVQVNSII